MVLVRARVNILGEVYLLYGNFRSEKNLQSIKMRELIFLLVELGMEAKCDTAIIDRKMIEDVIRPHIIRITFRPLNRDIGSWDIKKLISYYKWLKCIRNKKYNKKDLFVMVVEELITRNLVN